MVSLSTHARVAHCWALLAVLAALVLAACNQDTPPPNRGADFGDQKNHIHTMITVPGKPGLILLGTHYGLYRTTDGGQHWKKVLGDPGELAENLMTQYLTVSPVNPQRIWVEAISFQDLPTQHAGVAGIYTSTDDGATWSLATPLSSLPSPSIYYMTAGAQSEQQLYIYLQGLQANGLYETMDAGAHWQALGALPDTESLGLIADPTQAGHLFVYSEAGLFSSTDNGAHWQSAPGVKDGISRALLVKSMLYASGDDGTFVSQDGGAQFALMGSATFQYLASSPTNSTTVFGLSGSSFSQTTDGGQHWRTLSIPASRLFFANLAVDPSNGQQVYLGNSYPVVVYSSADGGQHWSQIAP